MKFPINVVWHTGGQDHPVTLVGSYGQYEGREWFKAESGTGIPADKIIWPKENSLYKRRFASNYSWRSGTWFLGTGYSTIFPRPRS